ncbi:MAG: hypothetical protein GEV10_28590 [Streptosporangiales bacterium]|nr:hypothetical protein [Streptosporangiales bacterium]
MDAALAAELDTVPDLTAFATADELAVEFDRLAEAYADACTLTRIGTSRLGEPLRCLTVGDGPRAAIVFAMPHPNEPVGGLTTIQLARRLCEDTALRQRTGYTWHIVPCIDPDGMRLNEGWLHGPFTRTHYARNFYRPAPDEQVDWTFPYAYKQAYFDRVMPETVALMRLIDTVRPAFLCSLHNGELGGVYYYVSTELPDLYPVLQEIPTHLGLPLDTGEPEAPYIERLATAVYHTFSPTTAYDYAERHGLELPSGGSGDTSTGYSRRYGTLSLVSEVPYWTDPRVGDTSPSDTSYATALRRQAKAITHLSDLLTETMEAVAPDLVSSSPYLRATRAFAPLIGRGATESAHRAGLPENDRPATVAEEFSLDDFVHCFRLRYAGMLVRALDGEIGIGNSTPAIRERRAVLGEVYDAWCDEAERASAAEPIPIRKLVATQYGAVLATATAGPQ